MNIAAVQVALSDILHFRTQFLQENNFQIRYNAMHERGWSTSYLITLDKTPIGYGATMWQDNRSIHDTIFEFFILPTHRHHAFAAFEALLAAAKPVYIESQTNLLLLSTMLFTYGSEIVSHFTLFKTGPMTSLSAGDAIFRAWRDGDTAFNHTAEPPGDFVLESNGEIVATGGFLLHYNAPFADLYMEVKTEARRQGLGSYLIQELERECYAAGRVPAARCNNVNIASRATLLKGGMEIAGNMLLSKV